VKRENLKTMKHRNTNTPKPLPTPAPKRTRRLQGGMSLIEVLVSVLGWSAPVCWALPR
jgi:hypothetical protein